MALNLFGISIPTPSLPSFSRGGGGGSGGRGRGGGGGGGFSLPKISVPKFSVPKIGVPSFPKFSVPKISVPKISVPKISVPKVELPKVQLPKVQLPKVEMPKLPGAGAIHPIVSLPAAAGAVLNGDLQLPKVELPKVELPKVSLPSPPKIPDFSYSGVVNRISDGWDSASGSVEAAAQFLAEGAGVVERQTIENTLGVGNTGNTLYKSVYNDGRYEIRSPSGQLVSGGSPGAAYALTPEERALATADYQAKNQAEMQARADKGDSAAQAWLDRYGRPGSDMYNHSKVPVVPGQTDRTTNILNRQYVGPPATTQPQVSGGGGGIISNFLGGVSKFIDNTISARDRSYDAGISHIAAGNTTQGGLQFGGTMAADVILPMDLADAANKWATGRGDEIDSDLALDAAIDAVTLAAAPLTFGASYAAGRALKAGKVAVKAAKAGEETMGKRKAITKLSSTLGGGVKGPRAATGAKITPTSYLQQYNKAYQQQAKTASQMQKQQAYAQQFAKFEQQQAKMASQMQKQQAKLSEQMAEMTSKIKAPTKGLDTAADLAKTESRWTKVSQTLGKAGRATGLVGMGLGAGAIGLTMMGGAGGPAPAPEPEEEDLSWLANLLNRGGAGDGATNDIDWASLLAGGGLGIPWGAFQFPDGLGGYTDAYGHYPAAYPDLFGLEGYGQDMCGALGELPGVGGLYEGARRRGLGIPAVVGTVLLVILIVAFLRSKKGKKMVSGAKKQVTGAAKGAKKAVGA